MQKTVNSDFIKIVFFEFFLYIFELTQWIFGKKNQLFGSKFPSFFLSIHYFRATISLCATEIIEFTVISYKFYQVLFLIYATNQFHD